MEKIGMFCAIGRMWKRCFDYKGKSSLREFWFPFVFQGILAFVAVVLVAIQSIMGSNSFLFLLPILLISFYSTISLIPWISLTVRRLHDAGKSGWWYFLIFAFGIGFFMVLIMCSSVGSGICTIMNGSADIEYFNPFENEEPGVYGPPDMM